MEWPNISEPTYRKIRNLSILIATFNTQLRTKRGLLNIVGSIAKSLFGTLDTDDLDLIITNIDKLFQDGNELKIMSCKSNRAHTQNYKIQ